jgi:hypothetical protein
MLDRISKRYLYLYFMAKAKLPKDVNQRAVMIAQIATGEKEAPKEEQDPIKAAASALGRLGGLKGGNARAKSLSSRKRVEIARKAAKARWNKR